MRSLIALALITVVTGCHSARWARTGQTHPDVRLVNGSLDRVNGTPDDAGSNPPQALELPSADEAGRASWSRIFDRFRSRPVSGQLSDQLLPGQLPPNQMPRTDIDPIGEEVKPDAPPANPSFESGF